MPHSNAKISFNSPLRYEAIDTHTVAFMFVISQMMFLVRQCAYGGGCSDFGGGDIHSSDAPAAPGRTQQAKESHHDR